MNKTSMGVLASLVMLVAACGGGGSDEAGPTEPANAVPDSASRSVAAMMSFLTELLRTSPEGQEPLDLGRFDPPRADSAEPAPLK